MTDSYTPNLVGQARDLGDGRFGVLINHDGRTYYVEHAVATDGLRAVVWDEADDRLVLKCMLDWEEVVTRLFAAWQQGANTDDE